MTEKHSAIRILVAHFFRRFFDNDTIQWDGDTQTTVVRALSVVTAPGLLIAFFLQNQYPQRSQWGAIEDQYFFVLSSLVVMGAVTIFEWEMLFPDRLDFLILSPLPLQPLQMLAAKAAALAGFMALFLVGCNLFGTLVLPAVSKGDFSRQLCAHAVAVLLAGAFAAFSILALGGSLLCILGASRFRAVSPVVQMLTVMALVLLLLQYAKFGDSMQALLSGPLRMTRWMPPLWFLGIYERILHGDAAPAFAQQMARYALRGTAVAGIVVLLTYPAAWGRMRRMAMEGSAHRRRRPSRWLAGLIHGIVRRPQERAVFHFIGQTIRRNNRYQVYLAMYCGTGLALAVACAVTARVNGKTTQLALSDKGLHAVMPLLLFWVIAGLRTAFAFPLNLPARWAFRITGVTTGECAAATRRWVFLCALGAVCCILTVLLAAGWDYRHLLVQAVCGLYLSVLMTDGFFCSQKIVPFNQPRMPGRTNFPLLLALWGALPPFIFGVIYMEMRIEKNLTNLVLPGLIIVAIHAVLGVLRKGTEEVEEEMEGYEGEFQLLNLS